MQNTNLPSRRQRLWEADWAPGGCPRNATEFLGQAMLLGTKCLPYKVKSNVVFSLQISARTTMRALASFHERSLMTSLRGAQDYHYS